MIQSLVYSYTSFGQMEPPGGFTSISWHNERFEAAQFVEMVVTVLPNA
ncbi:MAG: hypothetical protein GY928_15165 [Colwellia sp.]|nr:hypothetical protein [Colwellia sp.]